LNKSCKGSEISNSKYQNRFQFTKVLSEGGSIVDANQLWESTTTATTYCIHDDDDDDAILNNTPKKQAAKLRMESSFVKLRF
jgi:hypothetical protein